MHIEVQQPLPIYKLLIRLLTRSKVKFEHFQPHSIRLNQLICTSEQRAEFKVFFNTQDLPPSFLFNVSYRYAAQLLSTAKIPSNLVGLIHLSSCYQINEPVDWCSSYDLELSLESCMRTERGLEYQLNIGLIQHGVLCLSCKNIILDKDRAYKKQKTTTNLHKPLAKTNIVASNKLTFKLARAYANLSKDFNPIHMSALLAKLLGLNTAIMHGMYNLHWALIQIANNDIKHLSVHFNQPCYLPREVYLTEIELGLYALYSNKLRNRHLVLALNGDAC